MAAVDGDFWAWALRVYARPEVPEACLTLQDGFGQCVPYLLWAAWAAQAGRALEPAQLAAGADLAGRWEAAATGPLRIARRALKPGVEGIEDPAREALRAEVKALELKSEKLLMQTLAALPGAPGTAPVDADLVRALAAAVRAWPHPAPRSAIEGLARTLS